MSPEFWDALHKLLCKDPADTQLFDILKYTCDVSNAWFRGLYQYGVWIPAREALSLTHLGWGVADLCLCLCSCLLANVQ